MNNEKQPKKKSIWDDFDHYELGDEADPTLPSEEPSEAEPEPKEEAVQEPVRPAPKRTKKERRSVPTRIKPLIKCLFIGVLLLLAILLLRKVPVPEVKDWLQHQLLGYTDGDGFPVSYDGNPVEYHNFSLEEDMPAALSDTTFLLLGNGGKTVALRQHSFSSPAMARAGNAFLLYDSGSKAYCISTDGASFSDVQAYDYALYAAAITEKGTYALASAADGYASQVIVYDRTGASVFRWASQDYRITALAFDISGKYLAAAGFTAQNGSLTSIVQIFSLKQSEPAATFLSEDNLFLQLKFQGNTHLAAVGDKACCLYTVSGEKSVFEYTSALLHYDIDTVNGIALTLSKYGDSRRSTLYHMNWEGQLQQICTFTSTVKSLDLTADGILLMRGEQLDLLNMDGTVRKSVNGVADGIRALQASDGKSIFVLGHSQIHRASLPEDEAAD